MRMIDLSPLLDHDEYKFAKNKLSFLVMLTGFASLLPANYLVCTFPFMQIFGFPSYPWALVSIQATCASCLIGYGVLFHFHQHIPRRFTFVAGCLSIILFVLLLLFVSITFRDTFFGFSLAIATCGLIGFVNAFVQGVAGALASSLPPGYIVIFSVGQALAGFVMAVIQILTRTFSEKTSSFGPMLCVSLITSSFIIVAGASFKSLLELVNNINCYDEEDCVVDTPETAASLGDYKFLSGSNITGEPHKKTSDGIKESTASNRRGPNGLVKQLLAITVTLITTFMVFPGIISQMGGYSEEAKGEHETFLNLLVLTFQIGDCLSRVISIKKILMRKQNVFSLSLARILIIPFFCLAQRLPETVWGSHLTCLFLVFILAMSNGFICAAASVYAPASVSQSEQAKVGVAVGAYALAGCVLGSCLAPVTQMGV